MQYFNQQFCQMCLTEYPKFRRNDHYNRFCSESCANKFNYYCRKLDNWILGKDSSKITRKRNLDLTEIEKLVKALSEVSCTSKGYRRIYRILYYSIPSNWLRKKYLTKLYFELNKNKLLSARCCIICKEERSIHNKTKSSRCFKCNPRNKKKTSNKVITLNSFVHAQTVFKPINNIPLNVRL